MANFDRKRKPSGLTTSYELHDHLANTSGNPHPQYILRSELGVAGGSFNLVSHMNDPEAHANYYIKIVDIINSYNTNNTQKVTSGKAVYDFYQLYNTHLKGYDELPKNSIGTHDSRYAFKDHTHDNILTDDSINVHNTNPNAHPGMWIPLNNIVNIGENAPASPTQYVIGYDLFSQLRDEYVYNYRNSTSGIAGYELTTDSVFIAGKNYYILSNNIYTLQTVLTGAAIPANTYYNQVYEVVGPAIDNKLRMIFAARIHNHTYNEVGAAPTNHNHDDRYSLLSHNHDDRYSLIHNHPYLSETALETVGIYPNSKLVERTLNQSYDAMVPGSTQYLTENLNEHITQGNFYFDYIPINAPSQDSNSVIYPSTGLGTLSVRKVCTKERIKEESLSISNNNFYRVEQEFLDTLGKTFKRYGVNSYSIVVEATDPDNTTAVTNYIDFCTNSNISLDADETRCRAEVAIRYPAATQEEINGFITTWNTYRNLVSVSYDEVYTWSNWVADITAATDIGRRVWVSGGIPCTCCYAKTNDFVLTSNASFVNGKTYYTRAGVSPNFYYEPATVTIGDAVTANTYYEWNASDGNNYVDFDLNGPVAALATAINSTATLLMECVSAVGTDYSVGDVIIDPICSNKANNESSFLGKAQLSFMTVGGSKKIRVFLPLVWYVKKKNTTTVVYGSKTIPIATASDCSKWQLRIKLVY